MSAIFEQKKSQQQPNNEEQAIFQDSDSTKMMIQQVTVTDSQSGYGVAQMLLEDLSDEQLIY